jgi:hypothetical protein
MKVNKKNETTGTKYSMTIYRRDGDKAHSDNLDRAGIILEIKHAQARGSAFSVSEWVDGEWTRDLTRLEMNNL